MLRILLGAGLVMALAATVLAEDTSGTLKKLDAEMGTITVKPKTGDNKDFTITDTTRFVVYQGNDKREWTGKKGLTDPAIKEGRYVVVQSDSEGKVTLVRVGSAPKKDHEFEGTLKKVDAEASTLTVAFKIKKETLTKDFTIADTTRMIVTDGMDTKELKGKEGLTDEALKAGAKVTVYTDDKGKVLRVKIGAAKKAPEPKKDPEPKKSPEPKKESP